MEVVNDDTGRTSGCEDALMSLGRLNPIDDIEEDLDDNDNDDPSNVEIDDGPPDVMDAPISDGGWIEESDDEVPALRTLSRAVDDEVSDDGGETDFEYDENFLSTADDLPEECPGDKCYVMNGKESVDQPKVNFDNDVTSVEIEDVMNREEMVDETKVSVSDSQTDILQTNYPKTNGQTEKSQDENMNINKCNNVIQDDDTTEEQGEKTSQLISMPMKASSNPSEESEVQPRTATNVVTHDTEVRSYDASRSRRKQILKQRDEPIADSLQASNPDSTPGPPSYLESARSNLAKLLPYSLNTKLLNEIKNRFPNQCPSKYTLNVTPKTGQVGVQLVYERTNERKNPVPQASSNVEASCPEVRIGDDVGQQDSQRSNILNTDKKGISETFDSKGLPLRRIWNEGCHLQQQYQTIDQYVQDLVRMMKVRGIKNMVLKGPKNVISQVTKRINETKDPSSQSGTVIKVLSPPNVNSTSDSKNDVNTKPSSEESAMGLHTPKTKASIESRHSFPTKPGAILDPPASGSKDKLSCRVPRSTNCYVLKKTSPLHVPDPNKNDVFRYFITDLDGNTQTLDVPGGIKLLSSNNCTDKLHVIQKKLTPDACNVKYLSGKQQAATQLKRPPDAMTPGGGMKSDITRKTPQSGVSNRDMLETTGIKLDAQKKVVYRIQVPSSHYGGIVPKEVKPLVKIHRSAEAERKVSAFSCQQNPETVKPKSVKPVRSKANKPETLRRSGRERKITRPYSPPPSKKKKMLTPPPAPFDDSKSTCAKQQIANIDDSTAKAESVEHRPLNRGPSVPPSNIVIRQTGLPHLRISSKRKTLRNPEKRIAAPDTCISQKDVKVFIKSEPLSDDEMSATQPCLNITDCKSIKSEPDSDSTDIPTDSDDDDQRHHREPSLTSAKVRTPCAEKNITEGQLNSSDSMHDLPKVSETEHLSREEKMRLLKQRIEEQEKMLEKIQKTRQELEMQRQNDPYWEDL